MKEIKTVTVLGSGNIATQLSIALHEKGIRVSQIWSRTLKHAQTLAEKVSSQAIDSLEQLKPTDLFIVAISDDAISEFISTLPLNTPVVHTSGNTALIQRTDNALSGVFYPLQTFSKHKKAEWEHLPICLEANSPKFMEHLFSLAELLSDSVQEISSDQRKTLHLSAVIACNFTTHLAALSEQVLAENNLSLDLIKPLIDQTFKNISEGNVKPKQTGPAVRKDQGTIDAHVKLLSPHPDIQALYLALSKHIISYHHGEQL